MPKEPLVSVIIPIYNRMNHVDRLLEETGNYTFRNCEFIFIDDGSSDKTNSLLQKKIKKNGDDRYVLLSQQNAGPSAARNAGMKVCKGDFIQFLDSDDRLKNDKIEKDLQMLGGNPDADFVYSWIRYVNNNYEPINQCNSGRPLTKNNIKHNLYKNCWHCNAPLYRREFINKVGIWDESIKGIGDDLEFAFRVKLHTKNFLFRDEVSAYCVADTVDKLSSQANQKTLYAATCLEKYLAKTINLLKPYPRLLKINSDSLAKWFCNISVRYGLLSDKESFYRCLKNALSYGSLITKCKILASMTGGHLAGVKNVSKLIRVI